MDVIQDTVEYKDYKAFERDRPGRHAAGWHIVQIQDLPQRSGLKRMIGTGLLGAIAWKPPTHIIVIWEREDAESARRAAYAAMTDAEKEAADAEKKAKERFSRWL